MPEVLWTEVWSLRDAVDAQDRVGTWLPGRVVAVERDRVKIHFKGWKAKFDEWIGAAERLAPSGSRTCSAQLAERRVAAKEGKKKRGIDGNQIDNPTTRAETHCIVPQRGRHKKQLKEQLVGAQSAQEHKANKGKRRRLDSKHITPTKGQPEHGVRCCDAPQKKLRESVDTAATEPLIQPAGTVEKSDRSHTTGWSPAEDRLLRKLVVREGAGDWLNKAHKFDTDRSANALRLRWYALSKAATLKQQEEEYFNFVYGDQYQSRNDGKRSETASRAARSSPLMAVKHKNRMDPVAAQWRGHVRGEDLNDDICSVCEEGGTLLCCEGQCCSRAFHMACVGLIETPDDAFVCPQCTKQLEICLLCHGESPVSNMVRCVIPGCGRCYHKTCAPKLMSVKKQGIPVQAPEDTSLVCPRHMCVSCDDIPDKASSLVRCIRCPVAYHKQCVPAGVVGSGRNIVCPKHEEHPEAGQAWNVDSCLVCGKGGALVCCDTCIGAYHSRCIKKTEGFETIAKSEAWKCPECWFGMKPALGAVVWAKFPSLPLWPAQIVADAPQSIGLGPVGAFQVRLFGMRGHKDEWRWTHHANVGYWQAFDHKRHHLLDEAGVAGHAKALSQALSEANTAYKSRGAKQLAAQCQPRVMEYKKIVRSIRLSSCSHKQKRDEEEPPCVCSTSNPCCSTFCLNRLCYIECNPKTCPAGQRCCNRRFQTRDYPKLKPFKVGERGMGLRANEDIHADRFVIEYCGEIIDKAECFRRVMQQEAQGDMMFYAIALDANHYIDASFAGNLGRYVNHSCDPNMRVEKWNVLGETRVGFFAVQDISKGTELTIDYQFSTIAGTGLLTAMQKCSCGSSQCRGFLGAKIGNDLDVVKGSIRPAWCETLEVGMRCDALCANGHWREASVARMDARAGVTQLQLHFDTTTEDQNEWIPITAMKERMAPRGAMTGPEGQKKQAEIRRQQGLIDAEQAVKEAARKLRLEKARRRASERRAERLAIENAARELAQRKASLTKKWCNKKLVACQEECRRRGIWPGGDKAELADRIARVECGEELSEQEKAQITREEMRQARERKFTVSRVLRHRVGASGKDEFLVRWKSHTATPVEDTWEPRSSFEEGSVMLRKWDEHAVDEISTIPYQAAPEIDPEVPQATAQTYTARSDEQPFRIALKLGTTAEKIVALNLHRYPNLQPASKLKTGTVLVVPSGAKRFWRRSGHGWLGRVIQVRNVNRSWLANDKKRQRGPPASGKTARYLVVAWSNGSDEAEPAWRLVNESEQELELLEAEMVESITSSYVCRRLARSPSPTHSDIQQTTIEFGIDGPLEEDFDQQDGQWLLSGSQWLGRRVKRTFEFHDENGLPAGLPVEAVGRIVAYKPARRGYAAIWMIIHDDGEREDLELEEIKACVVPVNEPFHWPAQADVNRSLSNPHAVDVHPVRSVDDETAFPSPMRALSLTGPTPTSSLDFATTDAAHGLIADSVSDATILLTQPPPAASSTMAQASVLGTGGEECLFAAPPLMSATSVAMSLAEKFEHRATCLQLV